MRYIASVLAITIPSYHSAFASYSETSNSYSSTGFDGHTITKSSSHRQFRDGNHDRSLDNTRETIDGNLVKDDHVICHESDCRKSSLDSRLKRIAQVPHTRPLPDNELSARDLKYPLLNPID